MSSGGGGGGGGGGRRRGPVTLCTAATKRIRPTPHVPTPQPPPLPPAVTGGAISEEIVQAEDEAETLALHCDEAVMLLLHRDEVLASGLMRCKLHALTIDLAGRFSRTDGILKRGTMIEGLVSKSFLTNLCNILLACRRLMYCSPVRGIWLEVPDVKYQKAACAISYCQPQWRYKARRIVELPVHDWIRNDLAHVHGTSFDARQYGMRVSKDVSASANFLGKQVRQREAVLLQLF